MFMNVKALRALLLSLVATGAGAVTPIATIPVGNSPYALSLNADSTQATVVNLFPVKNPDGTDGPNVRVLDLPNRRELRAFRAGTRLVSVAVSGDTALVVNEDQDTVRIVNVATGAEIGQVPVGSRPSSVTFLTATTAVATNGTSGDLTFFDLGPIAPRAAGKHVLKAEPTTVPVGNDPRGMTLHPARRYLYVANGGDDQVAVVDTVGRPRVVARVAVGRNPVALAFAPHGNRAVVANLTNNTVSVLDTSNPAAPRNMFNAAVGAQPTFVAFGTLSPDLAYVSHQGSNYVTVMDVSKDKPQMVQGVIQIGSASAGMVVGNSGTRLYVLEFRNSANLRVYDLQNLGPLDAKPAFDVPGEPDSLTSLSAQGSCASDFYIAEAKLADGADGGFWGMEVAMTREPRALNGGFNLGGGFDGGGRNPGFGAFSLASAQRVTVTVHAQPLAGPIALKVDLLKDGQRIGGVEGTPTATAPLQFAADLTAGFHVVAIYSAVNSGQGTFQLGLATTGSFAGGVVVGGYMTRTPAGASLSGFGAFCVPQTQDVAIRLHGITEYGAAASGEMVLNILDAGRNIVRTIDNTVGGGTAVSPPAPPPVPANIRWYVEASATAAVGDGSSTRPFKSISEAIARAEPGDTIFVRNGVYSRSTTNETLPIGSAGPGTFGLRPNVQLIGAGAVGTIIDGENLSGNTLAVPSAGVRIAGFTVKRAGAAGIYVFRAANVVVESNFVTGNARFGMGGEGSSGLIVRNNVAVGNLETGIAFVGAVPAPAPPGAPTNCPAIAAGAYGAWIVNNTANDNRADGILTGGGGNYCVADNTTHNNGSSGIEFNNRTESGPVPPLNGAVVNNLINNNGGQQFAFAGTGILSAENNGRIDLIQGNRLRKNRPFGIGIFLDGRAGRITGNTVADSNTSGILVSTRAQADLIESNTVTGSGLSALFVDIQSNVTAIRGNTATGNDRGLSVLDRSVVGTVDGNAFDNNRSLGVEVVGTSRVDQLLNITANGNGAGNPASGGGFQVRDGSTVGGLASSRIENNQGQGGIFVNNGSVLTLTNTTVDGSLLQGLFAIGAGSRITVNGGAIRNTRRDAANAGGYGINAQSGATVSCAGTTLSNNLAGNVFASGGGAANGCN